jgi:hypothetical protein
MSGDWISKYGLVVSTVAVTVALWQLVSAIVVSRETAMAERIKDLYLFSQESLKLMLDLTKEEEGKVKKDKDKEVKKFIEASYELPLYPSYVSLIRKSCFFIRPFFKKIEYKCPNDKYPNKPNKNEMKIVTKKGTAEDIAIDIRELIRKKRLELRKKEGILNESVIDDFKDNLVLEIRKILIDFEV